MPVTSTAPQCPSINWGHHLAKGLVADFNPQFTSSVYNGRLYDNGIGKRYGTLVGNTAWAIVGGKRCLTFDGSGDYVTSVPPVTTLPVTMSAWFRPATGPTGSGLQNIVAIGEQGQGRNLIRIMLQGSGVGSLILGQHWDGGATFGNVVATTSWTNGQWQHVAVVFTGNSSRTIYVNGVAEATDTTTVGALDSLNYAAIASANFSGSFTQFLNGQVADVTVWNRALAANEVRQLYNDPFIGYRVPTRIVIASGTTYNETATGGVVVGGTATITHNRTATGGVVIGGTTQANNTLLTLTGAIVAYFDSSEEAAVVTLRSTVGSNKMWTEEMPENISLPFCVVEEVDRETVSITKRQASTGNRLEAARVVFYMYDETKGSVHHLLRLLEAAYLNTELSMSTRDILGRPRKINRTSFKDGEIWRGQLEVRYLLNKEEN